MKRRHTSVVDAQRVALATPAVAAGPGLGPADGAALYAQGLRHWGLRVARQLVLSGVPLGTDDDAAIRGPGDLHADQREQQQHADVARRWQIATRQLNGNPAPTGERSSLSWFRPDGDQRYFWRKVYAQGYEHLQSNEHHVLLALGTRNRNLTGDLRQHVGWLKHLGTSGHGTSVIQVETVDGGPNLDMWQDFAPCMGTGANALPLPLFANPTFLAALTRQALIALEALAQLKLVHGDLKPGNLCLAMPKGIDPSARLISGDLDLRHLQLRLIDFEFSFFEDFPRRVIALRPPQVVDGQAWEYNANFSPFVHACHRAAMGLTDRHDIQRCLGAIDWGADLWALGDMLEQYALQAKEFIAAYGSAFSSAFGFNSLEHAFADQALAGLLQQCGQLLQFAEGLKAHERSAAHAGELNLPDRIDLPHQRLWLELEGLFPLLGPRAASSLCTLNCFNPSIQPGSEDDAPAVGATSPAGDALRPVGERAAAPAAAVPAARVLAPAPAPVPAAHDHRVLLALEEVLAPVPAPVPAAHDHRVLLALEEVLAPAPAPVPAAAPRATAARTGDPAKPAVLVKAVAGPSRWQVAWQRLHQWARDMSIELGPRLTSSGIQAAEALGRHRTGVVAATLIVALPAVAWLWRADLAAAALPISQRQAASSLLAHQESGSANEHLLGRVWLGLADTLQPGQADAITLATLASAPQFDNSAPLDRAALFAARDRHLRALVQLVDGHGADLGHSGAKAIAERLLLASFHTSKRLEGDGPVVLSDRDYMVHDALAQLSFVSSQSLPLAAMLHAHLVACYAPARRHPEIDASLAALQRLPASAPSRTTYVDFASAMQARRAIAGTSSPCLLQPTAPAV